MGSILTDLFGMLGKRAELQGWTGRYYPGLAVYLFQEKRKRWSGMKLGNSLFHARKRRGMSQEEVAERLGVSRQTVSKWETDETLPDIRQAKRMSVIYGVSMDELITFDADVKEIQQIIERTDESVEEKIDWTSAWGKRYPILLQYQKEVNTANYAVRLGEMLDELKKEYHYSEQDAFLVLKDILAQVWKTRKSKK